MIKVFANGGGLRPPPNPAAFFYYAMQAGFQKPRTRDKDVCKWVCAMQAVFQENRTINKDFVKHMAFFIIQAVCLQMRGCVPAITPALFLSCARSLQLSS